MVARRKARWAVPLATAVAAGAAVTWAARRSESATDLQDCLASLHEGRPAEAEAAARRLATDPERPSPRAWLIVANARMGQQDYAGAIEAYRAFLTSCDSKRLRRYVLQRIGRCRRELTPRRDRVPPSRRLSAAQKRRLARVEDSFHVESTEHFVVRAYNPPLARVVAERAEVDLDRICKVILAGQAFPHSVDVYVWSGRSEYKRHATDAPEWAGGNFSITRRGGAIARRIDLTQRDEEGRFADVMLDRILPHELCHLVVHEYFGDADCPLFLNEGLAMLAELAPQDQRALLAGTALAGEAKIPLERLFVIDWNTIEAPPAFYAESYSFLAFVHERLTRQQFREFLAQVKGGCPVQDALRRALYVPSGGAFIEQVASAWEHQAIAQAQIVRAMERDPLDLRD